MLEAMLLLIAGLSLLILGSNLLVTSTENFSNYFGISGFIASFFLIGIATSAPEIFVSLEAALQKKTILAIGNTIGSNISNIALVFCVSVFFLNKENTSAAMPLGIFMGMLVLTVAVFVLTYFDKSFDMIDALVLLGIFLIILLSMRNYKDDGDRINNELQEESILNIMSYAIIGLIMLLFGSNLFIDGATQIAMMFGVSTYIIGLTLTALGTSLPELAASIQSAKKGKTDFIIGNIIGSNLFNLAIALSLAGLISPAVVDQSDLLRDISMLLVCMFVFYIIIKSEKYFIKTLYSLLLVITYLMYIVVILA